MTLTLGKSATATRGGALSLEWRADGSLWAMWGEEERAVSVRRCFPWSEPARHLSLRDTDEEEFAFVRDPADLDQRSRAAQDRKSTRLNSSHDQISYAVFCLKKKNNRPREMIYTITR